MKKNDAMSAQEIYSLASACRVPLTKACQLAGVHPATPARWKRAGLNPKPAVARRLVEAIMGMATAAGTLPAELSGGPETMAELRRDFALLKNKVHGFEARLKAAEAVGA